MIEPQAKLPDFSYDALNKHFDSNGGWLENKDYMVGIIPTNKQFIAFFKKEEPQGDCSEGKVFKAHGLKFHISLPEYNLDMLKKGWEIVRDTLIGHQVASFKIVRTPHKMSEVSGQEGKEVTVYVDAEPGRTLMGWQTVLEDVTKNLVLGNILPGYRAPGTLEKLEAAIKGSNYITYRYFNEKTKKSVWPQPDPCQQIQVTLSQPQAEIPKLEKQQSVNVEKIQHSV